MKVGAPVLTVVTVCWNALEDLKLTTASVRSQTARVAHVVVDGGSSDGTPQWLQEHKDLFAVAVSGRDKGIYDAMNKAVALCPEAEWLIFLNAGDAFADQDTARRLADQLARDDVDFIFGGVEVRSPDPAQPVKRYPPRLHARTEMPGCHQSCVVRASVMRKLKFDLAYKVAGDFELWLRATNVCASKTAFTPDVISTIAPEGYSARNEPVLQREYVSAISRYVSTRDARAWLVKRKIRMAVIALARFFRLR
jgi:glycosyltransferase involved in cell wall biosynthesis